MTRRNDEAGIPVESVIFTDLSEETRTALMEHLHSEEFAAGELLFSEGDPGDSLYVIRRGVVEISVLSGENAELTVARLGNGEFLGEMSIFEREPRSATCRAVEDTSVLRLHEDDLLHLIRTQPHAAVAIMRRMLSVIAARLDDTSTLLSDVVRWGEDARRRAFTDDLTGLFNRRFLDEKIPELIIESARSGRPLSLVMMDIDHFTDVNEKVGPILGDRLLTALTPVITSTFRESDVLVRYGGDEFAFLLPDTSTEEALELTRALRDGLVDPTVFESIGGDVPMITVSQGVATYPVHAGDSQSLWHEADRALYAAKERGRNRAEAARPTATTPRS